MNDEHQQPALSDEGVEGMNESRFFANISYNGTNFAGWQKQNNAMTVQQTIEEAFHLATKKEIPIVGCGRTDTGVHASDYYFHFNLEVEDTSFLKKKLNHILSEAIAINKIIEVPADAHARFDAMKRSYTYHLAFQRDPFLYDFEWYYPYGKLNLDLLNEAASLLLNYKSFFPFCKSKTQVKTMDCDLMEAYWEANEDETKLKFHISANRFLRGMVRLIVGMCINVASEKITLNEVREALEKQVRLDKSYSVPATGLFLDKIEYPYELV